MDETDTRSPYGKGTGLTFRPARIGIHAGCRPGGV